MSDRYPDVSDILRSRLRQALIDDGYDESNIDALVAEVEEIVESHRRRVTEVSP